MTVVFHGPRRGQCLIDLVHTSCSPDCIDGLVDGGVRGLLSVEKLRVRSDDELAVSSVDVEAAEMLLAAVGGRVGWCRPTGEPEPTELKLLPPLLRSRCWL